MPYNFDLRFEQIAREMGFSPHQVDQMATVREEIRERMGHEFVRMPQERPVFIECNMPFAGITDCKP